MKTAFLTLSTLPRLLTLFTLFTISSSAQQPPGQPSPVPVSDSPITVVAQTPYAVAARDGNQKIWSRTTWESNSLTGELTLRTNSYTELATASAHLVNGQWVDSSDQIQITQTGAQATNSQHKLTFLGNINSPGAIDITLPEGDRHLASTPIGVSFFEEASGKSVLLMELTNSIGELSSGNKVLYSDCFTDIRADLLYVNKIDRVEQLVVLRQQLPSPAEYGLDPETTEVQVISEFFNPPEPIVTPLLTGGGVDDHLDFGITHMIRGYAFAIGSETNKIPVRKQWTLLGGRQCIVESTKFSLLEPLLRDLPAPPEQAALHESPDGIRHRVASKRLFPERKFAGKRAQPMMVASAEQRGKGVAIDWTALTSQTNATIRGDVTYFLTNQVTFSGTTVWEGNSVLKMAPGYDPMITTLGSNYWATSDYRPVTITARDNDAVGEQISGSSGNPWTNYYGVIALDLYDDSPVKNVSISFAEVAMVWEVFSTNFSVSHAQVGNCDFGFDNISGHSGNAVNLHNSLVYSNMHFSAGDSSCHYYGEHLTVDRSSNNIGGDTVTLTNSLIVASPGFDTGTGNAILTSGSGVFASAGGGRYYLNGDTYRNAGTTNLSATAQAYLRQRTTYAPTILSNLTISSATTLSPQVQRDADAPDIGYHYPSLDYITDTVSVTNCALTVAPGTAIACYNNSGFWLQEGSSIYSAGTPLAPIWYVRYQSVQEQPVAFGPSSPAGGMNVYTLHSGSPAPNGQFRFSRFSCPAGGGLHFLHDTSWSYGSLALQDSELWGGANKFGGAADCTAALENNLFNRGTLSASIFSTNTLSMSNNLFYAVTSLTVKPLSSNRWSIFNNEFDSCSFGSLTIAITNSGYDAFWNCNKQLNPTNASDITLTNAISYKSGPLGNFYQPTNSPLVNTGSCTANLAGLYHYTVTTNLLAGIQIKETNSIVDIGLHYVATDSSGNPLDTDGDGSPDYFEDLNGNGSVNSGETDWNSASDFGLKVIITRPKNNSSIP